MAVVHGDVDAVVDALRAFPGVEVAAFNSPRSVTVSGPAGVVGRFCEESGLRARPLAVSHAFHSVLMEGAVVPFGEAVSGVVLSAPRVAFASSVSGGWHTAASAVDAGHWARGIREPVRFAEAVGLLGEGDGGVGAGVVWEIGAQPQLTSLARASWRGVEPVWLGTLRRDRGDQAEVYAALAAYANAGSGAVDWAGVHAGKGHRTATLPTYPFNRQRYWVSPPAPTPPSRTIRRTRRTRRTRKTGNTRTTGTRGTSTMASEYGLKRHFNGDAARLIGGKIRAVHPGFDVEDYASEVEERIIGLELKDRVMVLAEGLRTRLPEDYTAAVPILLAILEDELAEGEGIFNTSWFLMPVARFVEEYGLDHPSRPSTPSRRSPSGTPVSTPSGPTSNSTTS